MFSVFLHFAKDFEGGRGVSVQEIGKQFFSMFFSSFVCLFDIIREELLLVFLTA